MPTIKNKFYQNGSEFQSGGGGSTGGSTDIKISGNNPATNAGNSNAQTLRVTIATNDVNLSSINTKLTTTNSSLSNIDTKATTTNNSLSSIDTKATTTNNSLSSIDTKATTTNNSLSSIDTKATTTNNTLASILTDTNTIASWTASPTIEYTSPVTTTAVNGADVQILPATNIQAYKGFIIWVDNTGGNSLTDVKLYLSRSGTGNWVNATTLQDSAIENSCKTLAAASSGIAFMAFGPYGFKYIRLLASSGAATSVNVYITAQA